MQGGLRAPITSSSSAPTSMLEEEGCRVNGGRSRCRPRAATPAPRSYPTRWSVLGTATRRSTLLLAPPTAPRHPPPDRRLWCCVVGAAACLLRRRQPARSFSPFGLHFECHQGIRSRRQRKRQPGGAAAPAPSRDPSPLRSEPPSCLPLLGRRLSTAQSSPPPRPLDSSVVDVVGQVHDVALSLVRAGCATGRRAPAATCGGSSSTRPSSLPLSGAAFARTFGGEGARNCQYNVPQQSSSALGDSEKTL